MVDLGATRVGCGILKQLNALVVTLCIVALWLGHRSSVSGLGGRYFLVKNIKLGPCLILFDKKYLPPKPQTEDQWPKHYQE